jgi:hypothetical protein
VNDLPNMLLYLVCHYFIEDFCIYIHLGDWPVVLLLGCILVQFWDLCKAGFIEEVRQGSFPFYFMEKTKECWY